MLKVRVRFDIKESSKTLRLDGEAADYPVVGNDWTILVPHDQVTVQVYLGTIQNIKPYGNLLLVQTDLIVAEVWILDGEQDPTSKVIPLFKARTSTGGKCLAKGSYYLTEFNNALQLLRDEDVTRKREEFRLIKKVTDD